MNKTIFILSLFILSLSRITVAKTINIISAKQLRLELQSFVVIDAREEGFEEFHIPGSYSMQWKDYTVDRGGISKFFNSNVEKWGLVSEDKALIEQNLSVLGISNDSKVIIVGQPNLWGTEGRIAWNLLFWGLNQVYILDGGILAWKKEKFPLDTGASKNLSKTNGHFKVNFQWSRRVSKTHIKDLLSSKEAHPLFDIRTFEEFNGKKLSGQKRGGHLSGAKLIPFTSLYDRNGFFIKKEEFKKRIGLITGAPISYCLGGIRSSLFAILYEYYFENIVENYDGSLWEWSADSNLPLEI